MQKSTKLRLVISAGVVVLLAAIVLLVLFLTVWAQPTKQDFKTAKDAAEAAKQSSTEITKPFTTYLDELTMAYKKDSNPESALATTKESRAAAFKATSTHTSNVEKIDTLKALNDSELRKSYDTYKQQQTAYVDYVKDYIEAHELFLRASYSSCSDVLTSAKTARESLGLSGGTNLLNIKAVASYDKVYAETNRKFSEDCLADFGTLTQSPNKPYAEYAKVYQKYYSDRQQVLDDVRDSKLSPSVASSKLSKASLKPVEVATTKFITARTTDVQKALNQDSAKSFYDLAAKKEATAKE